MVDDFLNWLERHLFDNPELDQTIYDRILDEQALVSAGWADTQSLDKLIEETYCKLEGGLK